MRTTPDQLRQILLSDFYRGIYSLQALLLLRNPENAKGIADTPYPTPRNLMVLKAKTVLTRLTVLYTDSATRYRLIAEFGSDPEFKLLIDSVKQGDPFWVWNELLRGAIDNEHNNRIRLIVEKAPPNTISSYYLRCGAKLAAKNGSIDMMRLMMRCCSKKDLERSIGGALSTACSNGHIEIVRLLLERMTKVCVSDLNWCLLDAARNGHLAIVELLIDRGADAFAECLREAATGGHLEIAQYITDRLRCDYEAVLQSAIANAKRAGHQSVIDYVSQSLPARI